MRTSVKFILMFVLLMLSFSISGNALNITECSHKSVNSCQVSASSLDTNYSYRYGSDITGFDKSQTLSVSDVELGLNLFLKHTLLITSVCAEFLKILTFSKTPCVSGAW